MVQPQGVGQGEGNQQFTGGISDSCSATAGYSSPEKVVPSPTRIVPCSQPQAV